jgi:hypothetical protein
VSSKHEIAARHVAGRLCNGLLGLLWHQSQQPDHQLSPAVVAAVAAAREAAARVAAGELALICPSHGCHGCQLNGKLEVRKCVCRSRWCMALFAYVITSMCSCMRACHSAHDSATRKKPCGPAHAASLLCFALK